MFARNGKLWRPVQDCTHGCGTGIGLAEITALDQEKESMPCFAPIGAGPTADCTP